MGKADLVLLHAPSVYDFRERSIMFGPVSDMVPSTPVFEMYPLGFTTIAEYLERHGLNVRIVNLAVLMLQKPGFDVEKAIREMDPVAFGIDLHWLPHAHGSIEIARICKKYHLTRRSSSAGSPRATSTRSCARTSASTTCSAAIPRRSRSACSWAPCAGTARWPTSRT